MSRPSSASVLLRTTCAPLAALSIVAVMSCGGTNAGTAAEPGAGNAPSAPAGVHDASDGSYRPELEPALTRCRSLASVFDSPVGYNADDWLTIYYAFDENYGRCRATIESAFPDDPSRRAQLFEIDFAMIMAARLGADGFHEAGRNGDVCRAVLRGRRVASALEEDVHAFSAQFPEESDARRELRYLEETVAREATFFELARASVCDANDTPPSAGGTSESSDPDAAR